MYNSMNGNTNLEGATMNKETRRRVSNILADFSMGKTGTTTKAQVLTRLAVVLGTHAEAERAFNVIMR